MFNRLKNAINKLKGTTMEPTTETIEVHEPRVNPFSAALREKARTHASNSTRELLNEIADIVDDVDASEAERFKS